MADCWQDTASSQNAESQRSLKTVSPMSSQSPSSVSVVPEPQSRRRKRPHFHFLKLCGLRAGSDLQEWS